MKIDLTPDCPVTEEACLAATGKTFAQWSELIAANPDIAEKRREAINWIWDQVGRSPAQAWWGTTIWVEHERRIGRVQKDGRAEGYNICVTKSIKAPAEAVEAELLKDLTDVVRHRPGKDIRAKWTTPGIEGETLAEVSYAFKDGKTALMLNHNRIQTREEADGLRRAWGDRFNEIKAKLEG